MMLKLIIVDLDANLLSAWAEILQDFSEIVFINADFLIVEKTTDNTTPYPTVYSTLNGNVFQY